MTKSTARDVHAFQSALLAVNQMLAEHQYDPRLRSAGDSLATYQTTVYMLLGIGMATFLGVEPEEVWAPVTSANWRSRIEMALACPKLTLREYEFARYAVHRLDLLPDELTRARNLIEKVERLHRQGEFKFEPLDDDVPF